MENDSQFEQLSGNLGQTQENVQDAKEPVTSVRETAQDAEDILGVFEDIANRADDIEDTLHGLARMSTLLKKVPALKLAADKLGEILERVADRVEAFEARARALHTRIEPVESKIEKGREKLEEFEGKFDTVDGNVGELRDGVDEVVATLDVIEFFSPDAANSLDAKASGPNAAVVEINNLYDDAKAQAEALLAEVDDKTGVVSEVKAIQNQLSRIADELAFLRKPMAILNAAIEPVEWALDAVDAVYDAVVKPVVDPLLESLGIQALIDKANEKIDSLLPSITVIQEAEDYLDRISAAIDIDVDTSLIGVLNVDIVDFTGAIEADLLDPFDLEGGGAPTSGGDVLIGSVTTDDVINGMAGDDVISGGGGDDTLNGQDGDDVLIGGAGDDIMDGGDGEDGAIYADALANYAIERLNVALSDVTITHTEPRDVNRNDGIDELVNIETFAFADIEVTLDDLNRFQNLGDGGGTLFGTVDRDFLFGGAGADVLNGFAESTGPGQDTDDYLAGRAGNDQLFGGAGNDLLDGGAGFDTLDGGDGVDTASFLSLPVSGGGAVVAMQGFLSGTTDTLISIENVIGSDLADTVVGDTNANLIEGEAGNDRLVGRGGNDEIRGDAGNDEINGDAGDDLILGGSGNDLLYAGAGSDTYHGGADFDVLNYLSFDNSIPVPGGVLVVQSATGPGIAERVLVDMRKNSVTKFDGTGAIIGADVVVGVEAIRATTGADTLIAGPSENGRMDLYGQAGDDILWGNATLLGATDDVILDGGEDNDIIHMRGYMTAFGGEGDDTIYAADFGGRAEGGAGTDTLDFSGSDADTPEEEGDASAVNSLSAHGWDITVVALDGGTAKARDLFTGQTTNVAIEPTGDLINPPENREFTFFSMEVLVGSDFDDRIRNFRKDASVRIEGGDGDDQLQAGDKGSTQSPGTNGDQLYGGDGDDRLKAGYAFNQGLFGGDGNDVFDSDPGVIQLGNQVGTFYNPLVEMYGETGDDRFIMGRSQQFADGGDGVDTIDYYSDDSERSTLVRVDLALGQETTAQSGGDALRDSFVNIENIWGSSRFDTLLGDDGANTILGHGGSDVIDGRGGNDVLYGHKGQDTILGGDGDDFIHAGDQDDDPGGDLPDNSGDEDDIDGGAGIDTVSYAAYADHGDESRRLAEENLQRINADLALTQDTVFYVAFDFIDNGNRLSGDSIVNVENLIGSVGDDIIRGNAIANTLNGNSGDDLIEGRAGNDALLGGDGDDILNGGDGDDRLITGEGSDIADGGAGFDTLDYSGNAGGLVFNLDDQMVLETNRVEIPVWEDLGDPALMESMQSRLWSPNPSETQSITPQEIFEADPLFANSPDDLSRRIPNSFKSEVGTGRDLGIDIAVVEVEETDSYQNIEALVGGLGNDEFVMGAADIIIDGGAGSDTVNYAQAGASVIISLAAGTFEGAAAGDDISNIENITGGAFNDQLTGDANRNVLQGGDGDDSILGAGGDDILRGLRGADDINGGAGVDIIRGGLDNDIVRSGGGGTVNDRQIVSGDRGDDQVFGGTGADIARGGADTDVVIAGAGDDIASGDAGNDHVSGGLGNDILRGGSGDDLLEGGGGDDRLIGDAGDDFVKGGAGDDVVRGAVGNDRLVGGAGDDILWGDSGVDMFVFGAEEGFDIIRDFDDGSERINFSARGVGYGDLEITDAFNGAQITEGGLSIRVVGVSADDLNADDFIF